MENTVNIDVAVIYHWYDHLLLRNNGDANIVTKAIEEGNFQTFINIVKKYPSTYEYDPEFGEYEMPFFPRTASLIYRDNHIGEINIMNPIGFSLITHSEYECG